MKTSIESMTIAIGARVLGYEAQKLFIANAVGSSCLYSASFVIDTITANVFSHEIALEREETNKLQLEFAKEFASALSESFKNMPLITSGIQPDVSCHTHPNETEPCALASGKVPLLDSHGSDFPGNCDKIQSEEDPEANPGSTLMRLN